MPRKTNTNLLILQILETNKNIYPKNIAKQLNISMSAVSQQLTLLKEKSFITKTKVSNLVELHITPQGIDYLHSQRRSASRHLTSRNKRLHAVGLKYHILGTGFKKLSPIKLFKNQIDVLYTKTGLKNTDQVTVKTEVTTRVTSKSVCLYAPALFFKTGQLSIGAEDKVKDLLDAEAIKWERKLGIRLKRFENALYSEIISEEIADEHHPLADSLPQDQSKVVLARHPKDNKERLIADKSFGFRELETVHNKTADEDSDRLDRQFNGVLDGEIDLYDIPALKALATETAKVTNKLAVAVEKLNQYAKVNEQFKASHNKLIQDIDTYLINPKVNQHLRKTIKNRIDAEDQKQAKLFKL